MQGLVNDPKVHNSKKILLNIHDHQLNLVNDLTTRRSMYLCETNESVKGMILV